MHALEGDYWWFQGMRRVTGALLKRYLPSPPRDILDVGCGTGINLLWHRDQFRPRRLVGCDYSATALGWCSQTIRAHPDGGMVPRLSRGDVRLLPFADASFDLVISLDVFDLFAPPDGDRDAFAELFRVLRPGGVAFVRAPAYDWLISSHDHLFETRHRYSAGELGWKMGRAGFSVLKTTYANSLLFPAAAAQRLMRKFLGIAPEKTDTQPLPRSMRWVNAPLTACLGIEARLLARGVALPFGLSAISLGMKPARRVARDQ
jgi:SAM-dependent methyltransferase